MLSENTATSKHALHAMFQGNSVDMEDQTMPPLPVENDGFPPDSRAKREIPGEIVRDSLRSSMA
jgi:hypothetical protein